MITVLLSQQLIRTLYTQSVFMNCRDGLNNHDQGVKSASIMRTSLGHIIAVTSRSMTFYNIIITLYDACMTKNYPISKNLSTHPELIISRKGNLI